MGIKFYKKSVFDLSYSLPTATVTDSVASNTGQDFIDLLRNRNNTSGWMTTGSSDAANTTLEIDFNDLREFDSIMLLKHNFKTFTVKYWSGSAWVDFSTPINESNNSAESNYYTFDLVESDKLQLIINNTTEVDADKTLNQFLVCESLGEFVNVEPRIMPTIDKDRRTTKFLSGKSFISTQVGGFSCRLRFDGASNDTELSLIETLFDTFEGFLVSLSGGNASQFETARQGYRLEDIYFMNCKNEYKPEWRDGYFNRGMPIEIDLVEVN